MVGQIRSGLNIVIFLHVRVFDKVIQRIRNLMDSWIPPGATCCGWDTESEEHWRVFCVLQPRLADGIS